MQEQDNVLPLYYETINTCTMSVLHAGIMKSAYAFLYLADEFDAVMHLYTAHLTPF